MIVTVRCLATLAGLAPPDGRLDVPTGTTVGDVADALGVAPEAVGSLLVNGAPAERTTPLAPGDAVSIVPPISGG